MQEQLRYWQDELRPAEQDVNPSAAPVASATLRNASMSSPRFRMP
jgi:hypothetical protein